MKEMFQLGHFFSEMDRLGEIDAHKGKRKFQLGHGFSAMDRDGKVKPKICYTLVSIGPRLFSYG